MNETDCRQSESASPRRPSLRLAPTGLLDAAGALACGLTVTGFLGQTAWFLDLTAHFRLQYGVALAVASAVAFLRRKVAAGLAFGLFGAVNLGIVLACLWELSLPTRDARESLRLALLNVHTANIHYDRVKAFLRAENPHVAVLEEVDDRWMTELAELREMFPHQVAVPREDNFGIAMLSRLPLRDAAVVELGEAEVPSVTARVEVFGRVVTLLGTHPLPAGDASYAKLRNRQLATVARFVKAQSPPVVVLGDLNVTPWSHYFRRLTRDSGLRNSAPGLSFCATWPAHVWPLRIPIDHCLVSADLQAVRKEVGPNVGSDHLPLLVELAPAPLPHKNTNAP